MPGSIHAHVVDGTLLRVEVISDQGATLALIGAITDLEATIDNNEVSIRSDSLTSNPSRRSNMWAYAKAWYAARTISNMDALSIEDAD